MKIYQLQAKLDECPASADVKFNFYIPFHSTECPNCHSRIHEDEEIVSRERVFVVDDGKGNVLIEIR